MSKEYADKLQAERQDRDAQPAAGRHRPVPVRRLPAGRRHPLQGQSRLLGRQADDRRSGLRHHHRRRRCASRSCTPANARSCPIRTRPTSRPCKDNPNLTVDEQEGLNVGYLAYNTQQAPFDNAEGPQGPQHGHQQAGHHRRRLPGRRPGRQEPDPADDVVVQRRHRGRSLRSGSGQEDARRCRRQGPVT